MRKTIAILLAAAFGLAALVPSAAAEEYSSEAVPAKKPRSVILSSYFEDGIVTKKTTKTKLTAAQKKAAAAKAKKAAAKAKKSAKAKKAAAKKKVPAKKTAAKKTAKKKAKK